MLAARTAVALVAVLAPATAFAQSRFAAGYVMGRPIVGEAGGADHALALHGEYALDAELDLGVTVQLGHAAGSAEETLTRLAVMPTIGLSGDAGALTIRADIALGWQVASGDTRIAGLPVTGTEARGVRCEVGIGADAPITDRVKLRGRVALSLSGVYPAEVPTSSQLAPIGEVAVVISL